MQPLDCQSCEARVLIAKYSPAHTSIQWTHQAARACQEMASAAEVGNGSYLLRCSSLDRSIDAAVRGGEIDLSTRAEPQIVPIAPVSAPSR